MDPESDGATYAAVISVGRRATYYGSRGVRLLEAHLLGFRGDLYDRQVRVTLSRRLRPQRHFAGTAELVEQIRHDTEAALRWARQVGYVDLILDRPVQEFSKGRWGTLQRKLPRDRGKETRRALQRAELVARVVQGAPAAVLTHQWVAERTGLPEGYIAWHFPDLAELRTC